MSREIKFRAWDTFNERMIDEPYYFRKRSEPDVEDARFNTDMVYAETWQDVDDGIWRPCIVMQYTGLKDKNGKEIYEGDVVNQFGYLPQEVWFEDGKYLIGKKDTSDANFHQAKAEQCEVVGNIYENPELLNQGGNDERTASQQSLNRSGEPLTPKDNNPIKG